MACEIVSFWHSRPLCVLFVSTKTPFQTPGVGFFLVLELDLILMLPVRFSVKLGKKLNTVKHNIYYTSKIFRVLNSFAHRFSTDIFTVFSSGA